MQLVLDAETTVKNPLGNKQQGKGNTPYMEGNKLVSVQYRVVGATEDYCYKGPRPSPWLLSEDCVWLNHKEWHGDERESFRQIQSILDKTTLMIGHHLKYDLSWLRECGFKYDGAVWDTMIFEYLQAKGLKPELGLAACAERRNLDARKSTFMKDQFDLGVNTDEMPLEGLREYGMLDIYVTEELFLAQQEILKIDDDTKYMMPAQNLMNDYLGVLTDIERAGCKIDEVELNSLEVDFRKEHSSIHYALKEIVQEVMGDKPYNIASPEQLSQIVYGFSINDKKQWTEIFGIGSELRNGVSKKRYPKNFKPSELDEIIRQHTTPLYKTEASQCQDCYGKGFTIKYNKDGKQAKRNPKCKTCDATGVIYTATMDRAGFCLKVPSSKCASSGGFSASKEVISILLDRAEYTRLKSVKKILSTKNQLAVDFLGGLSRIGSIENYLNSFITGIKENQINGILHTNFNQCITATGRLSSTKPNFQNLPRANTFPLRKAIISRFTDGYILSCDLAQLEFRVAAYLSQCRKTIEFIKAGQDIHMVSARFFTPEGDITPDMRQDAKKHTFAPLYGAQGEYTEHFYNEFPGLKEWHGRLSEEALTTKQTKIPSGRIYAYPNAERSQDRNGRPIVKPFTQISNYPVQGFATGDIMPAITVNIYRQMKALRVKSRLILTVHDDLTADVHPAEKELMIGIFKKGFGSVYNECKQRFGIDINVPIDYDLSIGRNWLDKEKIK